MTAWLVFSVLFVDGVAGYFSPVEKLETIMSWPSFAMVSLN
jgi:hypothetical protein